MNKAMGIVYTNEKASASIEFKWKNKSAKMTINSNGHKDIEVSREIFEVISIGDLGIVLSCWNTTLEMCYSASIFYEDITDVSDVNIKLY